MNSKHLATFIAAPLLMLAWSLSAQAADSTTAPTTCKDGTTSTATGRGACSGHGGVQKSAQAATGTATEKAPAAAAPAATPPPSSAPPPAAAAKPAAPATTAKPAASTPSSTSGNTDPTGATAKCKDGTYSKSQHHSGTCSRHGGVAEWLTPAH